MSMLQNFNEQQNIQTATRVVYENVQFPNGFNNFIEALVIENIISQEPTCTSKNGEYVWTNEVSKGGIKLVTSDHPYVHPIIENVVIEGQQDELDIIHQMINRHDIVYEGSIQSKLEVKIEYHDELNPTLWKHNGENYVLLPDVQEALEEAAAAFYDYLDLPDLPIDDITITGSSANYNWTDSSDLDLHIIIDMAKAEKKYGSLVAEYFDAHKKLWNDMHDISVKGIPIEFYVQSTEEQHDSTGIYSLKNEEWVIEPEHEPPTVNDAAVKAKAEEWIKKITKYIKYSEKPTQLEQLMKKVRDMRKAGLSEAGEFSTENLVFKILRNQGLIDNLADRYNELVDRGLSLEEEEYEKDDPWEELGYTKKQNVPKSVRSNEKRTRINLNVPYAHRETAKQKGAKWDPGIRKWYMMVTNDELKNIPSSWR